MRYRGFCYRHYAFRQKSIKLEAKGVSDRMLGLASSRSVLVDFYINGEFDGQRAVIENLDADLLKSYCYKKEALYRELIHANLGELKRLENKWKKNTRKNKSWKDWIGFNRQLNQAIALGKTSNISKFLNTDHYFTYMAAITIIGTHHLNNHNIPMFRPKGDDRFIPVGYDFSANYQGDLAKKNSSLQLANMSMNRLYSLILSEPKLRRLFYRVISDILKADSEVLVRGRFLSRSYFDLVYCRNKRLVNEMFELERFKIPKPTLDKGLILNMQFLGFS